MICCYDIGNTNYGTNGDVVLSPMSCKVHELAGGIYECTLIHPVDREGKWRHLVFGALIKAPVPVATIQGGHIGQDVDVYRTTVKAALREGPSEPTHIYYTAWSSATVYSVGSKVSYSGHNYRCVYYDEFSSTRLAPPASSSWWTRIADETSGSPVLTTLAAGTEIYFVEDSGSWSKVSTKLGVEGYIKDSQIEFVRHETVQPVPDRTVTDQLFRIYSRQKSSKDMSVTVKALHVQYDLNGVVMGDCDIALAGPPMAIMRMQDAWLGTYPGQIATNLSTEENGTYTGNVSGKTGTFGFLDPDQGMVHHFRAQLFRDNWDLFIMKNDVVDRGVHLTYGVNLKGITENDTGENLITQVIPVAKDSEGNDLYLPEKYVDSPLINNYPVVKQEWLKVDGQVGKDDGTGTDTKWTLDTLLEHMRTKAAERFSVDHADALTVSVTVDFTLLSDTVEYQQYRDLERLYMYDQVRVYVPLLDIDLSLQVSEFEWDAIGKRYLSIKVGDVFDYGGRTVSGYQIGDGAIDYYKLNQAAIDRIIKDAK